MKKKIFIMFLVCTVLLTAEGVRRMWVIDSRIGHKVGLNGDNFEVITWVDPQTGVEYLIFEDSSPNSTGRANAGISVVPRLNSDGSLRIVK